MNQIPTVAPFKLKGPPSAHAARWKALIERLEIYFAAAGIEEGRRRPLLLHLAGEDIHDLSKTTTETGPPFNYTTLKEALTARFEPFTNPDYEHFLLRQAKQNPDESVDVYYERLRKLASTRKLPDAQFEIRAQFIQGCASNKLREQILQDP